MPIPYLACMVASAAFYHLPPRVLPSIQRVEGGKAGLIMKNTNGTFDLGLMQVNTIWVKPLSAYTHLDAYTIKDRLIYDPCFSIAAAAVIMRQYMAETHGDVVTAVGYYHSHQKALSISYRAKVIAAAGSLFGPTRKEAKY